MKEQKSRVAMTGRSGRKAAAPKPPGEKGPLKIPPLLLEGDDPPVPPASAAAPKFALGPGQAPQPHEAQQAELPASYGTGKLLLLPRDPHWLYTHWDLSAEQQRACNAQSIHRHLIVRIHSSGEPAHPAAEVHVHPESRCWFIEVTKPGATYVAELGYYRAEGQWVSIGQSEPATTPPAETAVDKSVHFAKAGAAADVKGDAAETGSPALPATIAPRVEWLPSLPPVGAGQAEASGLLPPESGTAGAWTTEQEHALQQIVGAATITHGAVSSLELVEWVRHEVEREIALRQFGQPGPSSPSGPPAPQLKAFWFSINAELVIYGATDPSASVTIGDRPVELRPDGTFSVRLALPDGEYELEVAATSPANESRHAKLKFRRCTEYMEQP